MFRVIEGSIFDSTCDYITNTINTQGAMGAGLALEFRLRVPEMYSLYKELCLKGDIRIGEYWIYEKSNRIQKKILNFPVKTEFAQPSEYEYIIKGLDFFLENYEKDGIFSIAMPTLGSRLGRLDDEAVLEVMREDLSGLPIQIEIYQKYAQDRLTTMVKRAIGNMSPQELGTEFGLGLPEAELIKRKVHSCFLLSDLVAFQRISSNIVQKIYDFGFRKFSQPEIQ